MKSPFYFIVEPTKQRRYNNTIEWDGIEFISNSSKEEFKFSNREAVVIETPSGYTGTISKGDTVLVHHNVFKYYNDMKGREKSGRSFLKDNTFFIDETQLYAVKKNETWSCVGKYCLVKPVEKKDYFIDKLGTEEPLVGILKYGNEQLKQLGVNEGDTVCFEPHSEYEFTVDGEKLYRMYTSNIAVVL